MTFDSRPRGGALQITVGAAAAAAAAGDLVCLGVAFLSASTRHRAAQQSLHDVTARVTSRARHVTRQRQLVLAELWSYSSNSSRQLTVIVARSAPSRLCRCATLGDYEIEIWCSV